MLINCTVNHWHGWPNKEKKCVLNTSRMSRLIDASTTGNTRTRLLYSYREGHRRGNLHEVTIDKTITQINTASETTPYDDFVTLPVFPDENPSATPVNTAFKVKDIARAVADPLTVWRSYVWVHHNEVRLSRYLVDLNVDQLYERAMNGSAATSTPNI